MGGSDYTSDLEYWMPNSNQWFGHLQNLHQSYTMVKAQFRRDQNQSDTERGHWGLDYRSEPHLFTVQISISTLDAEEARTPHHP